MERRMHCIGLNSYHRTLRVYQLAVSKTSTGLGDRYLKQGFHSFSVFADKCLNNTVTYRLIARQRLGKHIPAGANARNDRTSIARQRISKHA
jgi:hypothetical protein